MQPDIMTLSSFYQSAVGVQAAQLISARIAAFLPDKPGQLTVGLGYCLPYLDRMMSADRGQLGTRTVSFMPARQGVSHWPGHSKNKACLVEPTHMPLHDSSVDRLLLVHVLEHASRPSHLLREVWRVLAPGGHVIVVVPNRLRAWAAAEHTPFGHGRPYSRAQLSSIMADQMLPPDHWCTALAMPPIRMRGLPKVMPVADRIGGLFGRSVGGALIMHAQKQVYGALPKGSAKVKVVPVFTQSS